KPLYQGIVDLQKLLVEISEQFDNPGSELGSYEAWQLEVLRANYTCSFLLLSTAISAHENAWDEEIESQLSEKLSARCDDARQANSMLPELPADAEKSREEKELLMRCVSALLRGHQTDFEYALRHYQGSVLASDFSSSTVARVKGAFEGKG